MVLQHTMRWLKVDLLPDSTVHIITFTNHTANPFPGMTTGISVINPVKITGYQSNPSNPVV